MKINPSAGYDHYKNIVQEAKNESNAAAKALNAGRAEASANTDKVTFSEDAAARAELYRLASALSGEVESVSSEDRLAALRQQIEQGQYSVSAESLAEAILSGR